MKLFLLAVPTLFFNQPSLRHIVLKNETKTLLDCRANGKSFQGEISPVALNGVVITHITIMLESLTELVQMRIICKSFRNMRQLTF